MRFRIRLLCVISILALLPFGCRKPKIIVGTWNARVRVSMGRETGVTPIIFTFGADGTMTLDTNGELMAGTYDVADNHLHMILKSGGGAGEMEETDVFTLDSDELTLQTFFGGKDPLHFSRQER